jgi:hypothetical protein
MTCLSLTGMDVYMMRFSEGLINKGKNVLCYLLYANRFAFQRNREKKFSITVM